MPLPVDLKITAESLSPWRGGETEGLQRLEQHLTDQVSLDFTWVMLVALGELKLVSSFYVWFCLDLEKLLSCRVLFQLWLSFPLPGLSSWQPSLPWCQLLLSRCFTHSQFHKVEKIFSAVLLDLESCSLS